jgi:hypothetical protein
MFVPLDQTNVAALVAGQPFYKGFYRAAWSTTRNVDIGSVRARRWGQVTCAFIGLRFSFSSGGRRAIDRQTDLMLV